MKRKIFFGLLATFALVVLVFGAAWATDGNLPGGTPISVEITSPSDGALISSTPGDVTLEGTASVGEGLPQPDTLIVYVMDVSYSTIRGDGGTGCGGDQNGDSASDTILDCEIAAAKDLNTLAASQGTVGEVGVAVYGGRSLSNPADTGGAAADVGPAAGDQLLTGPSTDAGGAAGADVDEVLSSAFSTNGGSGGVQQFTLKDVGSNGTNFSAGLGAAVNVVNTSTKSSKIIVFMSDGLANTGQNISTVTVPAGVVIQTFAIGSTSDCTDDPYSLGSLQDIANKGATGSACTKVSTVADLPDVVPGVIASQLTSLELSVDSGTPVDISASATPALPQDGPASVTFSNPVSGLAAGAHEFCVTANGSDSGGVGEVTDCIQVTVAGIDLAPATATNELGTPDQTHTVTATVSAGTAGVAGVDVDFDILSGPNAGTMGTVTTDSNGEAAFTYTAAQGLAGLGTDQIQACFTDDLGVQSCAEAEKVWQDTTPPEVDLSVSPDLLWPPNHKYHKVEATLVATDAVDPNPTITLVSVTSDEPDNGLGDGDTAHDIIIQDDFNFKLRAERSGLEDGRIYTITYEVSDASGNTTTASATVFVPHDKAQAIHMGYSPVLLARLAGDPLVFLPMVQH